MLRSRVLTHLPPDPVEHLICNGTSSYEQLDKVNPLYGVGTVTDWYLTTLGLFITWMFHPEKRWRNFISVDLTVIVTLPLVAAGHLAHLMWNQPSWRLQNRDGGDLRWDESRRPDEFAALAPFQILRAFQIWNGLLLLNPVLFFRRIRRACLIFATELVVTNIQLAYGHVFNLGFKNILLKNPDGIEPTKAIWVLAIVADILIMLPPVVIAICADPYCRNSSDEDDEDSPVAGLLYVIVLWGNMLLLLSARGVNPTVVSAQRCPSQHRQALRLSLFPNLQFVI